jgi:hypothetical protein
MPYVTHKEPVGSVPGTPEVKVEWEREDGSLVPKPVMYMRSSRVVLYSELCGPEEITEQAWKDLSTCIGMGILAMGLEKILRFMRPDVRGEPLGYSELVVTCVRKTVSDHIDEITHALSVEKEFGEWQRVTDPENWPGG